MLNLLQVNQTFLVSMIGKPVRQQPDTVLCFQIAAKKLVIAGAIAEPVDGGLLIFEGVSKEEVRAQSMQDKT